MTKGVLYYTHNKLDKKILHTCQEYILASSLPIVSVSLKPINFGENIVLDLQPNYITMLTQIITGLQALKTDYVFFCEHDVLYPASHFDFTPPTDSIFYYNAHVWRWKYLGETAITYDRLICLSTLCVNRTLALDNYVHRMERIKELHLDKNMSREPGWARAWGYEPGTKKTKRGGFSNDDFETFWSREPIIDIRHNRTFSPPKITLDSFIHKPTNWQEKSIDEIPGWNLRQLFNIENS